MNICRVKRAIQVGDRGAVPAGRVGGARGGAALRGGRGQRARAARRRAPLRAAGRAAAPAPARHRSAFEVWLIMPLGLYTLPRFVE